MVVFLPIAVASLMFFGVRQWVPSGTTNEGELITPPVAAREVAATLTRRGKWVLIQPVGAECDDACRQMLYLSRQVVAGLGKDAGRIERVMLASSGISATFTELLTTAHPDARVITREVNLQSLRAQTMALPVLFLMDPNGNIMMFYRLDQAGKPMLKDLKHLLRVSKIG